jgi:hypothetical protein
MRLHRVHKDNCILSDIIGHNYVRVLNATLPEDTGLVFGTSLSVGYVF